MATLPVATRNAAVDAVANKVNDGTTAGRLKIRNAALQVLVDIPFADPAFAAASGGSASLNGGNSISAIASATGTATNYIITDSDGVEIMSGTVGTTGAEINLSSVAINQNDTVTITSLNLIQAQN